MSAVAPTGNGPFEFTDGNGRFISIPLTAISFNASGTLVASTAVAPLLTDAANKLLLYMDQQGLYVPAPAPSPKPAAIIRAVDPGPDGNKISIEVLNISSDPDPTAKHFDIKVTETNSYNNLTVDTVTSMLGTAGLVHINSTGSGDITKVDPASLTFSGGDSTTKAQAKVQDKEG